VANKRIDLLVERRRDQAPLAAWTPPPVPARGYAALYRRTVLQAPEGCDLDFLTAQGRPTALIANPSGNMNLFAKLAQRAEEGRRCVSD